MKELFSNVNWVEIVLGFLLGLTPIIFTTLKNAIKILFEKSKLIGTYHFYHLSGTQTGVVRKKMLIVSKSFKGYLKVEIPKSEHTGLFFKGRVLDSQLAIKYIHVVGDNHPERLFLIINVPIHRNFTTLTGVFVAMNIHNIPLCGKILLSKQELTDDQAKQIIGTKNLYADISTKHH